MTRIVVALLLALACLCFVALGVGEYAVSWREVFAVLTKRTAALDALVVLDLRLPRVLLALGVGAALAVAGAAMQAALRNPLAEPGLLGINSGAALTSVIFIAATGGAATQYLPLAGFAGAVAMAVAIYALSWRDSTSSLRIIFMGIGLGALAGATVTIVIAFAEIRDVQRALIWLAGSVYHADWTVVRVLILWLILPFLLILASARELDLMSLGDRPARSLGLRVDLARGWAILMCTALAGAAVSAAGTIGFVGLIAPHLARRLVGPRHLHLVPVAALIGAALVLTADLIGRTVLAPVQFPAGLVTALIGAPFFGYLLWGRRHAAA
jgi:iron complex transport system permease protein